MRGKTCQELNSLIFRESAMEKDTDDQDSVKRVNRGFQLNRNRPINGLVFALFITMCVYYDGHYKPEAYSVFSKDAQKGVHNGGRNQQEKDYSKMKNYSKYSFDEDDTREIQKSRKIKKRRSKKENFEREDRVEEDIDIGKTQSNVYSESQRQKNVAFDEGIYSDGALATQAFESVELAEDTGQAEESFYRDDARAMAFDRGPRIENEDIQSDAMHVSGNDEPMIRVNNELIMMGKEIMPEAMEIESKSDSSNLFSKTRSLFKSIKPKISIRKIFNKIIAKVKSACQRFMNWIRSINMRFF